MSASSVSVYPREGTTYPDADGVPITSVGATVAVSKYILDALRFGFLLTWDPLNVYLPDDRTDVGGGGSGAPVGAGYITTALTSGLTNERVIAAGTGISISDGGPNAALTISATAPAGTQSVANIAALGATPGTTNGQIAVVLGYYTANDGGGGLFQWDAGSVASADGGLVISATGGRWRRLYNSAERHVDWFGAKGDGIQDDTLFIQRAINSATTLGCAVVFGAKNYRITATLKLGPSYNSIEGIRLQGANCKGPQNVATKLTWDGAVYNGAAPTDVNAGTIRLNPASNANTTVMVWMEGAYNEIHNIGFATNNKAIFAGLIIGSLSPTASGETWIHPIFTSACTVEGCSFATWFGSNKNLAYYGMSIGGIFFNVGNLENMRVLDCMFDNCSKNGALNFTGGQGYNTVVQRCFFIQSFNDGRPVGVGISTAQCQGIQLQVRDCDWNGWEVAVQVDNQDWVYIDGGQSENCKKLFFAGTGANGQPSPVCIKNVRINPEKALMPSAGPNREEGYHGTAGAPGSGFIASDGAMIEVRDGRNIHIVGCQMFLGIPTEVYMEFHPSSHVVSEGNTWNNDNPFRPFNYFFGLSREAGGVWSTGDWYRHDPSKDALITSFVSHLPPRRGGFSAPQDVVIYGASTTATVTVGEGYDVTEDGSMATACPWGVDVEYVSGQGNPAVGYTWVSNKVGSTIPASTRTATFTLNTSVAPGAGKSITYRVSVNKDRKGLDALSARDQFLAMLVAGDIWFDADNMSGSDLVDYQDATHKLALTGGSLAAPAADALFNNMKTLAFTGSQYMVSNRASSTWKFLHDGTGGEIFLVFAPTSLAGTSITATTRSSPGAAGTGYTSYTSATSGATNMIVANGATLITNVSAGTLAVNVGTYMHDIITTAQNYHNIKSAPSGNTSGAGTSTGNPEHTLWLGATSPAANFATMKFRAMYAFPRVLTAAQRTIVRNYIREVCAINP